MKFIKNNFSGGLNRLFDSSKIGEAQYYFLQNGRSRYNVVEPVAKPVEIGKELPSGKLQGLYAMGSYVLAFVSGKAYWRLYKDSTTTFVQIPSFNLSAEVEHIYACLVPASTVNHSRSLSSDEDVTAGVKLTNPRQATLACVVCQDGLSQPQLIFPDGSSRVSQRYDEWSEANREYVPIGKQMLFSNNVLYVVSTDGSQIYRSVTGRPLDFMIIIDSNGEKLAEAVGKADNISVKVDMNVITALAKTSLDTNSFIVCTAYNSYLVTPLTTGELLPYGEPIFQITGLFNTGAVNQYSIVDTLGDTVLVDFSGLRSFNAIRQVTNEGRNSVFSATVQGILKEKLQVSSCCAEFDNYVYFSVLSSYGSVVVVYDTIAQVFVSIDKPSVTGTITQFCVVYTSNSKKLLARTSENKLYEMFSSSEKELCSLYIGDFCTNDPALLQKPTRVQFIFNEPYQTGTITATIYTDSKQGSAQELYISQTLPSTAPETPPFGSFESDLVQTLDAMLPEDIECWKFGVFVQWSCDVKLNQIAVESNEVSNSQERIGKSLQINDEGIPRVTEIDSPISTGKNFRIYGQMLHKTKYVSVGSAQISIIDCYYNYLTAYIPFYLAPGLYTLTITDMNDIKRSAGNVSVI